MVSQAQATGKVAQSAVNRAIFLLELGPQVQSNGVASHSVDYELAKNALVRRFEVRVTAGQADWVPANSIGRLRVDDLSSSFVIDFGLLRTVSGIALLDANGTSLTEVHPWLGSKFTEKLAVTPFSASKGEPDVAILVFDEVQAQKLKVTGSGISEAKLASSLLLRLPEVPADLAIRINGGAPVWSFPGAVPTQVLADSKASASATAPPLPAGWTIDSQGLAHTTVDLTSALAAFAGDAEAAESESSSLQIALTARIPGVLSLKLPSASGSAEALRADIAYLSRATNAQRTLQFEQEGSQQIALAVPEWGNQVLGARFVTRAKLGPDRTLPAEGPLPLLDPHSTDTPASRVAELLLDPEHAVAIQLQSAEIAQLSALRLPIRVGAGGAELRVVLLKPAEDQGPGEPLDGGTSQPVVLDASPSDTWITASFPKPIKLATPLWAKVLVSRGSATWSVTAEARAPVARRGPPEGPFLPLPAILVPLDSASVGNLADLGLGARLSGRPSPELPVAPVILQLGATGQAIETTPSPKGSVVSVTAPADQPLAKAGLTLKVTSRVAGEITFEDFDLILSK